MWNRQQLKYNAKQELRVSYWLSFGVATLAGVIAGGFSGGSSVTFNTNITESLGYYRYGHMNSSWLASIMAGLLTASFFVFVLGWVYSAFIGNVIAVGNCAYFIRAPYGDRRFNYLFHPFKNGRYMGVVKAQFKTNIIIFAWSLLFVIPGIVKSYQYKFVPYLLAENPELSADECMALSRQMTDGQKMEMFMLDLSFLGWYLLGALACGVGMLFVAPYHEATLAQLYFALRPRVEVPVSRDGFFAPADVPLQYSAPQYPQGGAPYAQQQPWAGQPGQFGQQQPYQPQPGQPVQPQQQTPPPQQEPAPPVNSPYNPGTPPPADEEHGKEE